jgi:hypothetical protein
MERISSEKCETPPGLWMVASQRTPHHPSASYPSSILGDLAFLDQEGCRCTPTYQTLPLPFQVYAYHHTLDRPLSNTSHVGVVYNIVITSSSVQWCCVLFEREESIHLSEIENKSRKPRPLAVFTLFKSTKPLVHILRSRTYFHLWYECVEMDINIIDLYVNRC